MNEMKSLAEVLHEYFCTSNEPLAVAYREQMAQPTHLEDWMDGVTVMDMLNISARTLQYYRDARMFPYVKIGNKIYYKRADIEAYMEAEYAKQKGGAR